MIMNITTQQSRKLTERIPKFVFTFHILAGLLSEDFPYHNRNLTQKNKLFNKTVGQNSLSF